MNLSISLTIFILGLFSGSLITRFPYFTLDPSINIIELLNLLFLVLLTFLVPYFVTRRIDNDKGHKNMLISEADMICRNIEIIETILQDNLDQSLGRPTYIKLISYTKKLSQSMEIIEKQTMKYSHSEIKSSVTKLKSLITSHWNDLTGDEGIKPKGFTIQGNFILKIQKKQSSLILETRKYKFNVNKL